MTQTKALQSFLKDVIKNDISQSYVFRHSHLNNEFLSTRALNFFGISFPICFGWAVLCAMYVGITNGKSSFMSFSFFAYTSLAFIFLNTFLFSNLNYFKISIQKIFHRFKIWNFEKIIFKDEETFLQIMNFLEFNSFPYFDQKTISTDMMKQSLSLRSMATLHQKTLQVQENIMLKKLLKASDPNSEQSLDELQKKELFSFDAH